MYLIVQGMRCTPHLDEVYVSIPIVPWCNTLRSCTE